MKRYPILLYNRSQRPWEHFIYDTILRLPQEVQQDVFDNIFFIPLFGNGLYDNLELPSNGDTLHFIVINFTETQLEGDAEAEEIHYRIAREIAHYIFRHRNYSAAETWELMCEEFERQDRDADCLVREWGFVIPERKEEKNE